MPTCYTTFLDQFLTKVPVNQLDEAVQFVNEVKLMCADFIHQSPLLLHKQVSKASKASQFFLSKNRHRAVNSNGIIFNEAVQAVKAYERGVDLHLNPNVQEACVVLLPDNFKLTFSTASFEQVTEAATLLDDPALLGRMVFEHDLTKLTAVTQQIIATDVPFYYCIRIN